MSGARCPEPKPVAVFLLTLAGVLGGITGSIWVDKPQSVAYWACLAGGIGLSTGVAIAIARKFWARFLWALILGILGPTVSLELYVFLIPGVDYELVYLMIFLFCLPTVVVFVTVHHYFLLLVGRFSVRIFSWPAYLALGILLSLYFRFAEGGHMTWHIGFALGLFQYLAMLVALAVDRRQQCGGGA